MYIPYKGQNKMLQAKTFSSIKNKLFWADFKCTILSSNDILIESIWLEKKKRHKAYCRPLAIQISGAEICLKGLRLLLYILVFATP